MNTGTRYLCIRWGSDTSMTINVNFSLTQKILIGLNMLSAKEQSKAAQKEKEAAVHAKKEAQKAKQWAVGAKDTTKQEEDAAKAAERERIKAERSAQEAAEGGGGDAGAGGGAPVMLKCKDCKQMYQKTKKGGCQNCLMKLLGGAPKKK